MAKDDENNAALALAELERLHVAHGAARRTDPLFVADAAGTPLTCDDVDRMFIQCARVRDAPGCGSTAPFVP